MPNGKQGQPQGKPTGGAQGGMRDQLRDAGQHMQERASEVGQQVREGLDSARESAAHGYRQAQGMIARHPTQSVLMSFGVGFGVGVILSILLTQREETWYERYMPDSLRDIPDRLRHVRLPDAISRNLPDSFR